MELAPCRIEIPTVEGRVTNLRDPSTPPHEMQNEEYQPHDEQNVNQAGAYVEREKPKQPKHDQYRCD
jgi:hypothetical protein